MCLNYWLGHMCVCISVWIMVVCHAVSVAATHACIRFRIWEMSLISWFSCPIGIGNPNLITIARHWQDRAKLLLTHVRLIIRGLYCYTHRADWRLCSSFRSSSVPRTHQGNYIYVQAHCGCVCFSCARSFFIFSLCLCLSVHILYVHVCVFVYTQYFLSLSVSARFLPDPVNVGQ